MNITILRGTVAAAPRITALPDGSVVHNFEIRAEDEGERHVVPVAWHDPKRPPKLDEGDSVVVVGAVRKRWFRTGGGSQSRTEVLATTVARDGSRGAGRAVESALGAVTGSGPLG